MRPGATSTLHTPGPLAAHLRHEIGIWPPPAGFTITSSPSRREPGWDGRARPVLGVSTPESTVIALDPDLLAAHPPAHSATSVADLGAALGGRIVGAIFRWADATPPSEPLGVWRSAGDATIPDWLRPFGGEVLVAVDDDGRYLAGVGLKRHDDDVWEISVGTEEHARGRGLARRLVVSAASAVLAAGRIPTYLHDPSNHASAKVADASGFPERGWRMLFFVPASPPAGER